MKKYNSLLKIIVTFIISILMFLYILYNFLLSSPSSNKNIISFEVKSGDSLLTIADELKDSGLIRSKLAYKLYIKFHKVSGLEAGVYELTPNMNVVALTKTLSGKSKNTNNIKITFKEGINMRAVIALIEKNTSYSKEDVYDLLSDDEFLNELIEKYWFLTDEIKNKNIYYSLEGYLFPNTYEFKKNATLEEMFITLLNETDKVLSKYKSDINKSSYSIHELLTLASIVELEASRDVDRASVAGVFYNRLENNWSLGSDVTTYYAARVDMSERDLYVSELNDYNAYNTRSSKMAGKLPVGPICNPSEESILAAINPVSHNYFYFVADKNKKTYFSRTSSEHAKTISELKEAGLWYEY